MTSVVNLSNVNVNVGAIKYRFEVTVSGPSSDLITDFVLTLPAVSSSAASYIDSATAETLMDDYVSEVASEMTSNAGGYVVTVYKTYVQAETLTETTVYP